MEWIDLENCYKNNFNIDLESVHIEMNSYSNYHSINGRKLEIEDLDINLRPIGFSYSEYSDFKLISYKGRNFLKNKFYCFPCSRVYENIHGSRWVELLIIPTGTEIKIINQDTSVRYSFYTLKLFNYLKSFEDIVSFDKIYCNTFSNNGWFSQTERIQFLVRSSAPISSIFKAFESLKLFNPFQIALFSLIDDIELKNADILNCLLNNNEIPPSIPYITRPSFKISISESTLEILKSRHFEDFIYSLNFEEVRQFFEIEFISNSLNLDAIYSDFKMDILDIKIIKRWEQKGCNGNISDVVQARLKSIGITEVFIKNYYKRLKKNIRSIENKIRLQQGYNVVGSLYNESRLFNLIQSAFPYYEVISQYSPNWLGRQRLDIFIKELNIAIEYNGKQHYEPVLYFGGQEGYLNIKKRDKIKKKKCKENKCQLIEVKYDEDLETFAEKFKMKYLAE